MEGSSMRPLIERPQVHEPGDCLTPRKQWAYSVGLALPTIVSHLSNLT